MTDRKPAPSTQPPKDEGESGTLRFSSDPEVLRAENARLQRDLTRALEERNRLLKNRGLPSGQGKSTGLRVLEKRLEETRAELDHFKHEGKLQEEKQHILQDRLTTTGRIPGIFIARLEDAVISFGGMVKNPGTPLENAAEAPDRVAERFDMAVKALCQLLESKRIQQDSQLNREIEKLRESLEYKRVESSNLHKKRDALEQELEEQWANLRQAETELEVRDHKLDEVRGRLDELEEINKKQETTILRQKKQLNNLRGSVDAELYAYVTGSPDGAFEGGRTWRDNYLSRPAIIGLALGIVVTAGVTWLSGELKPTGIQIPENGALQLPYPQSPAVAEENGQPTPVRTAKPIDGGIHQDALRSGGRGPELIKLPGATFTMGTDSYAAPESEKPAHAEQVKEFYISRFEVSFDQYDTFARSTGLEPPQDQGWGRGDRPVINVSWENARAYTNWLTRQTGQRYRLPTEAEWEYAIGGGSEELYWWGNDFEQKREICFNCGTQWDGISTAPVGSAQPNLFGLHDMGGNAMEWVEDCLITEPAGNCITRVVRGGAFNKPNDTLRTTTRRGLEARSRHSTVGFRVVREATE